MDIKDIYKETKERLENVSIGCFKGMEKPLLLISDKYPGIWLEHVYDSVFYAMQDRSKLYLAENTIDLFISGQKQDGQYPCFVLDKGNPNFDRYKCPDGVGYWQIQECVSFAKLCWLVYQMNRDKTFLKKIYISSQKWVSWLRANRMTRGEGLVECFVGFDTGHDNSGRLEGLSCKGNYAIDGVRQNAAVLPENDDVAPMIAVDMNCNFYATLTALSSMANELGLTDEANEWTRQAQIVKENLFEICFDKEDCFFYDVDKNGVKRKYLSCTIFYLFMEGVLDKIEDADLIAELYRRHIANPKEFATPYPYPSMAVCDPSRDRNQRENSWGYMSMGLIALRATLWMKKYGFEREFDNLCRKFVEVWTTHFDKIKLGQEYDPITGVPTNCSEWYSSTMLFYLYAVNEINKN